MDMNNKENENVEVLDDFVVDSSNQINSGQVNMEPTLESSNTNVFGVDNMVEPTPMSTVEPVAPFDEPTPMPTTEPVAPFDEPAPVPTIEPVAPVVEPVVMPSMDSVESTLESAPMPAMEPVEATVDTSMDLMSDFPTSAPEVSEPFVETPVPVEPVLEQQPVEVVPVVASEPIVEAPDNATLESNNIENNVGINNDQNIVPEYDASAPVTQASEQQKVKGGKNDTLIFIIVLVVVIMATIIALPFIFNIL